MVAERGRRVQGIPPKPVAQARPSPNGKRSQRKALTTKRPPAVQLGASQGMCAPSACAQPAPLHTRCSNRQYRASDHSHQPRWRTPLWVGVAAATGGSLSNVQAASQEPTHCTEGRMRMDVSPPPHACTLLGVEATDHGALTAANWGAHMAHTVPRGRAPDAGELGGEP